tara:strand:+ start:1693 stop:2226 length:534 start_codon:yes stop_codon:yes gene_type:complete
MKILMIDDTTPLNMALKDAFIQKGWDITVAGTDLNDSQSILDTLKLADDVDFCLNNKYTMQDGIKNEVHGQAKLSEIFLDKWDRNSVKYIINMIDMCALIEPADWTGSKQYRSDNVMFNASTTVFNARAEGPNLCNAYMDRDDMIEAHVKLFCHVIENCKQVWPSQLVLNKPLGVSA